jgi:dihydroneopterin aldolase
MIVEVQGIDVFGRHGVNPEEQRDGQTFLVDATVDVAEPAADDIAATVDYRRVRDIVHAVNERRSFQLLETFAAAIADALQKELPVERVRVRVRKPGIAWAEWAAATVERP